MMQLTFNPLDPREVADTINTLRILGALDAGVQVLVQGEPTLTEAEARRQQAEVMRRFHMHRREAPANPPAPSIDIGDL